MKDFLGREIKVGDMIVHVKRQSSSVYTTLRKVIQAEPTFLKIEREYYGYRYNEETKQSEKVLVKSVSRVMTPHLVAILSDRELENKTSEEG